MMIASAAVVLAGSVVTGVAIPWCFVSFATMRQRLTPGRAPGAGVRGQPLAINGPQTFGTLAGAALIGVVDYRLLLAVMTLVIRGLCRVASNRRGHLTSGRGRCGMR